MILSSGALEQIELNIAAAAKAYSDGTGDLNTLTNAVNRGAFAIGYLKALGSDYLNNAMLAKGQITQLGHNALNAVADNITSVQKTIATITFVIRNATIDQASNTLSNPVLPGTIDPTAVSGGMASTVFDPDNDADDDTGEAGY